ncbi:geranylgeranyl transferase type-1 subunit beta [Rhizina undulata]
MSTPVQPALNKPKHVKYWQRCLKTCLPTEYTSTDLNRITLGFFCISALDLLGELPSATTEEERNGWRNWIYSLQLPGGGFRGSPATRMSKEGGERWDIVNLPASYFAVATLVSLGDDLEALDKEGLLRLLPRLQRNDGSFGECLGADGEVVGGMDMRFVYCASAIRWILRGKEGAGRRDIADFDVEEAVRYIRSSETYDHGISEKPFGEAHAGLTYCAISALSLLNRLHPESESTGISSHANLTKWLVHRQTPHGVRDELEDDELEEAILHGVDKVELGSDGRPLRGGFHGRCNKRADTCYSFWVGGSLDVLKRLYLIDVKANRRFLLEKTQHFIGGFSKLPLSNSRPDILHSFMGLAALSLMREEGINRLDSALCMSMQAKERLMAMEWWING